MSKFSKFKPFDFAPIESRCFLFSSAEQEHEFLSAPQEVQDQAMLLLQATIRKSMRELNDDFMIKAIDELNDRVSILEKRSHERPLSTEHP